MIKIIVFFIVLFGLIQLLPTDIGEFYQFQINLFSLIIFMLATLCTIRSYGTFPIRRALDGYPRDVPYGTWRTEMVDWFYDIHRMEFKKHPIPPVYSKDFVWSYVLTGHIKTEMIDGFNDIHKIEIKQDQCPVGIYRG